jgi:hypothetical protein
MPSFPILKSGAVLQYPATRSVTYLNHVIRFLDGAEQRYRGSASLLHRWEIQVDRLDEAEVKALQEFFALNEGMSGQFSFTDPWDGAIYPNCNLEADIFEAEYKAEMQVMTKIVVREGRNP